METQFSNEHVTVAMQKKPACIVGLEVFMVPESVQQMWKQAIKSVRKEVSIPGFRKGKAPENLLETQFHSSIEKEWRSLVVDFAFQQSLRLTSVVPFTKRSVRKADLVSCSMSDGAKMTFSYEAWPEIPQVDFGSIRTVRQEPKKVEEADTVACYRQMLLGDATWENIIDRKAHKGDYVEIDIDVIEPPAHNVCTNQRYWIDDSEMPSWLQKAVIGLMPDENIDTISEPDDSNESGKKCRITVKTIKTPKLPEENQEFAERKGATSIEALKQRIQEDLKKEQVRYADEVTRFELRNELVEKYPVDLPETLVQAEVEARFNEAKNIKSKKREMLPKEEKLLKDQVKSEAIHFLNCMLLLQPLAAKMQLKIHSDELQSEMMRQLISVPVEQRSVFFSMGKESLRERLIALVMMQKIEDYLIDNKKEISKA